MVSASGARAMSANVHLSCMLPLYARLQTILRPQGRVWAHAAAWVNSCHQGGASAVGIATGPWEPVDSPTGITSEDASCAGVCRLGPGSSQRHRNALCQWSGCRADHARAARPKRHVWLRRRAPANVRRRLQRQARCGRSGGARCASGCSTRCARAQPVACKRACACFIWSSLLACIGTGTALLLPSINMLSSHRRVISELGKGGWERLLSAPVSCSTTLEVKGLVRLATTWRERGACGTLEMDCEGVQ